MDDLEEEMAEEIVPEYWSENLDEAKQEVSKALYNAIRPNSSMELYKPYRIMFLYDIKNLDPSVICRVLDKHGMHHFSLRNRLTLCLRNCFFCDKGCCHSHRGARKDP